MSHQLPIPTLQPFVRMVSDEQVRELHYATLEILRKTGVKMQDPQGRDLLLEAGAWESGERIKIPENMVTDAIDKAPSRIPMHDRLGNLRMPLELGKVFFGSGSDTTFTLDPETGQRRRSVAQDVRNMATVGDALENIDFIMSMANPSDVPPDDLYLHAFINMIRGSVKPNVYTAKDRKDMEDIYRVAVSVAGGETELREKPFSTALRRTDFPPAYHRGISTKAYLLRREGHPGSLYPFSQHGRRRADHLGWGGGLRQRGMLARADHHTAGQSGRTLPVRDEHGCPGYEIHHSELWKPGVEYGYGSLVRAGKILQPACLGLWRRHRQQDRGRAGRDRGYLLDHERLPDPLHPGARCGLHRIWLNFFDGVAGDRQRDHSHGTLLHGRCTGR
jgi:hypothetical protein